MRYWEDFSVGDVFDLGTRTVTRQEIVDFAAQWDPQPFHVDEQAAQSSSFGGLIASGWHTASICMRLYVDALLLDAASMGSPGVDELRWLAPVRPDDTLTVSLTVIDSQPSSKNPGRGTVRLQWEAVNQDGVVVLRMSGRGLFGRRATAQA
jgi:acyl dehydratase